MRAMNLNERFLFASVRLRLRFVRDKTQFYLLRNVEVCKQTAPYSERKRNAHTNGSTYRPYLFRVFR